MVIKRSDFKREDARDLELVVLEGKDELYLNQVFEQCPQLSLNKDNYRQWFANPSAALYALISGDRLISTLGATRNHQLIYRNLRGESSQATGTYISAFWANPQYNYANASSALFDYVIETEEKSATQILGTISDRFLAKHPEWSSKLPQYYLKRGFELIGHSLNHQGPVATRRKK